MGRLTHRLLVLKYLHRQYTYEGFRKQDRQYRCDNDSRAVHA